VRHRHVDEVVQDRFLVAAKRLLDRANNFVAHFEAGFLHKLLAAIHLDRYFEHFPKNLRVQFRHPICGIGIVIIRERIICVEQRLDAGIQLEVFAFVGALLGFIQIVKVTF
jgi:hypothetical protein